MAATVGVVARFIFGDPELFSFKNIPQMLSILCIAIFFFSQILKEIK